MLLNQYEVEKYCQVSAQRGDLTVVWEDVELPRTDGKRVYLPRITSNFTEDAAKRLMWFTTHEAEHNVYTDFDLINEKKLDVSKSRLAAMFNQLEDDNIDYINGQQFRGDRELCSDQVGSIMSGLVEHAKLAKEKGRDKEMPEGEWDAIMAMLAFEARYRGDYCHTTSHLSDEFRNLINNKKGHEQLDKLLSGDYHDALRELRTDTTKGRTKKTYELARRIYEEVFDKDADKEEERLKELAKQQESAEGGAEGKGKDKSKGKGKPGEGEGEEGEGGDGKGKKYKRGGKEGEIEYNKEMVDVDYDEWSSDPSEFVRHTDVGGGERLSYANYEFKGGRDYVPCPLKETKVIDYEKKTSNDSRVRPGDEEGGRVREQYEHEYRELAKTASDGFANRVRMLLQIRSKGRTQYGTKTGRLHSGNLYRTVIKDAPGYNERVFKKKIVSDVLDTAVQIVVDDSGSMMGNKYAHAITAAIHLSNTLGNTLHIPTEILGFTEWSANNAMFVFRSFDTKILSKEALLDRMIHAGRFANQNADGDSILFAYSRIRPRKEKRKVMIVLSDGSPAGDRGGDLPGFTKQVVQSIENEKVVEIVGVGIMDNNVQRFYKDNMMIKSAEEIETALLKLIQRKLV